jgi:hypothetical protein
MSDTKIKTSNIGNLAVTHALLHTDMDLTSKTVQVATPTSNTHPATKAYVDTEVANLIDSAPGTLDTLNELAAAVNDDANFNATIASSIATKLPLAGGTLTGNVTFGDNNKVIFGAGSDANIRHDGANTKFSHTGSGGLYLGADLLAIQNSAHNETFLSATANGAVTLYHDNSAKLATTSTGIDVTGSGVPNITLTSSSGPYSYIESNTVGSLGFAADEGNTGSSTNINFRVDGNEIARLNGGEFVVNDGSRDIDFRVESNNNTSMLFVDAGNDRISVGSGSTYSMFNVISSNDNTSDWWTNNVATQYIQNTVGHPVLKMNNNNSNRSAYLVYNGNGSAQGFHIFDRQNEQTRISAYTSSVVINEAGTDVDFRVESDTNTHALFVDASYSSTVCFGTSNVNLHNTNTPGVNLGGNGNVGQIIASTSANRPLILHRYTSTGMIAEFGYNTATVGSINVTASGTTYNTTSDRRLKDNIEPISDATDKLMDMKPVTHTWIDNPESPQVHGFIAQEMQEVVPEAVSGDAESDEMMSMDYGRITPVIVAALQDALKEIEELKTRINELEAK